MVALSSIWKGKGITNGGTNLLMLLRVEEKKGKGKSSTNNYKKHCLILLPALEFWAFSNNTFRG